MKIQIIEDDRVLSDGIRLALQEPNIIFVQDNSIRQAKDSFERENPDIVILDLNLPDGSGLDYLRWLRANAEIPVLILTANDMEMDEVIGLSLGADDYMTKPFSIAVLRARIQVLMRRMQKRQEQEQNIYAEAGFYFDFHGFVYRRNESELTLSVNEQKLLQLLVENRGRVLTRSVLVDRLWNDGGDFVDENALSVTVNRLRSKLEAKEDPETFIQTVYGQGYMWKRVAKHV